MNKSFLVFGPYPWYLVFGLLPWAILCATAFADQSQAVSLHHEVATPVIDATAAQSHHAIIRHQAGGTVKGKPLPSMRSTSLLQSVKGSAVSTLPTWTSGSLSLVIYPMVFALLTVVTRFFWSKASPHSRVPTSLYPDPFIAMAYSGSSQPSVHGRNSFALQATLDDMPVRPLIKKGPTRLPNLVSTFLPPRGAEYDLVVIGAGPGGEAAAVLSAQLGAHVLVVERRNQFGGPTGLTSKAVRQATKQISSTCDSLGGDRRRIMKRLWAKSFATLKSEAEVSQAAETRGRLQKNGVELTVVDITTISSSGTQVTLRRGPEETVVNAKHIVIATGSRPARPTTVPFTPNQIVDATEITTVLSRGLPQSIGILGGGVIAVEYATVLASVGVGVTIFTKADQFMPSLPEVLRSELISILLQSRILVVNDPVDNVESGDPEDLRCTVTCGRRRFRVDLVLYSAGRDANSEGLGLEEAGIKISKYGRIAVDENYQTSVPSVYAIGDVVGGGLASIASKSGRAVARHLFGSKEEVPPQEDDELFRGHSRLGITELPVTLWTLPEMATVGASVEELRNRGLRPVEEGGPIITGMVKYSDLAQGRLAGGKGFVQIVAQHIGRGRQSYHRIVGVHILGVGANDLIQLAALLVHTRSSLETVANTPWAAVTLSQLLQHASDDALCRSPFSRMSTTAAAGAKV